MGLAGSEILSKIEMSLPLCILFAKYFQALITVNCCHDCQTDGGLMFYTLSYQSRDHRFSSPFLQSEPEVIELFSCSTQLPAHKC